MIGIGTQGGGNRVAKGGLNALQGGDIVKAGCNQVGVYYVAPKKIMGGYFVLLQQGNGTQVREWLRYGVSTFSVQIAYTWCM